MADRIQGCNTNCNLQQTYLPDDREIGPDEQLKANVLNDETLFSRLMLGMSTKRVLIFFRTRGIIDQAEYDQFASQLHSGLRNWKEVNMSIITIVIQHKNCSLQKFCDALKDAKQDFFGDAIKCRLKQIINK